MRVWIDLTNTAHVIVLRPFVERLEAAGHEVALTARPLSHTLELLDDWGHPYLALGRHGGARRADKARAAADRARRMVAFGRRRRFGCALGHGSTDLPVACRVLGIPNTTMFDYEFALAQHHVNCRLAHRVLVPDAIPPGRLGRFGARPPKLVRFEGLKEDYVLHGFAPDPGVLTALGVDPAAPLCVVRTAPSYALYLGGAEPALLPRLLRRLDDEGVQTVVLARNREQGDAVRAFGLRRSVVPPRAVDARSLVALADALVSAGGTMNREAAVLGTPVWTMFEGPLGGVDELLVREGRLRVLRDVDDVVLERREGEPPRRRPRSTRDPAELLALALPWLPA
jgi:predicted glycosyltransferase